MLQASFAYPRRAANQAKARKTILMYAFVAILHASIHLPRFTQVFYVIEGAVAAVIHESQYIVATGGMFIVPRGQSIPHAPSAGLTNDLNRIRVQATPTTSRTSPIEMQKFSSRKLVRYR